MTSARKLTRIVVDTNLFISGTILKRGKPFRLLEAWRGRQFALLLSGGGPQLGGPFFGGILMGYVDSHNDNYRCVQANNEATPTQSYYLQFSELPSELSFGPMNGQRYRWRKS